MVYACCGILSGVVLNFFFFQLNLAPVLKKAVLQSQQNRRPEGSGSEPFNFLGVNFAVENLR